MNISGNEKKFYLDAVINAFAHALAAAGNDGEDWIWEVGTSREKRS